MRVVLTYLLLIGCLIGADDKGVGTFVTYCLGLTHGKPLNHGGRSFVRLWALVDIWTDNSE